MRELLLVCDTNGNQIFRDPKLIMLDILLLLRVSS